MYQELLNPENSVIAFLASLQKMSKDQTILNRAIVCDIDRIGAQIMDHNQGNPGPMFTIRGRILSNQINDTGSTEEGMASLTTFYPLFDCSNFNIPERGELVWVLYDSSNERLKNGFWLSKVNPPLSLSVRHPWRRNPSGEEFGDAPEEAKWGGKKPLGVESEYDNRPDEFYEPYPLPMRLKPGDKGTKGRSNTSIVHSFNAEDKANKRGYIAIETELLTIKPDEKGYHVKNFLDPKTQKWQMLNLSGSRIIVATKMNVDKIFISKDTEKDGTGKLGNMQKVFDKHFIEKLDDTDKSGAGNGIEEKNIQDDVNYGNTAADVTHAEAAPRKDVIFDKNVASLYMEAEVFRSISRLGDEVNHAVLGERLSRFLIRSEMDKLYMLRLIDQLRDRVHKLGIDVAQHEHPIIPGQTLQALASTLTPSPILYEMDWRVNTSGDVGSDSGDLSENGTDISKKSGDIKDRIVEIRKQIGVRIRETSSLLSRVNAIN